MASNQQASTLSANGATMPLIAQKTDCDLVYEYDWDTLIARAICLAESGGDPYAANWSDGHDQCLGSYSLMQVACIHYNSRNIPRDQWFDPKVNMDIAYELYKEQGWTPWSAYTTGKYISFVQ